MDDGADAGGTGMYRLRRSANLLPEPREPDAGGRTSGGGRSIGDFSLATQRKVTRQAAQRRRHPVEDGVLVSCMAKPCQLDGDISPSNDVTDPLTLALSRKGRGDGYLGAGAGDRLVSAKVATAPDCRYQIAPLTIDLGKGSTDARRHITEPEWSYLWF